MVGPHRQSDSFGSSMKLEILAPLPVPERVFPQRSGDTVSSR